jgi:hypothetical protein
MEEEILKRFKIQDKKLTEIYDSAEKTRKYLLWTLIITVAMIVLPLLGLFFAIPVFLNTLNFNNFGL